jgi:Helix-turn-helix domain
MSEYRPPLRARVFQKSVTAHEELLILVMLELSGGTGEFIWPSIQTMAAYAKLDPRTVQRLIHGHIDARRNERVKGLLERGALSELAPGNGARHKTVSYRLNLDALPDDPAMVRYLIARQQRALPGIRRQPISGEPIPEPTPVPPCHPGGRLSPMPTSLCHPPGGAVPPDSRAFDSKPLDSKPLYPDCEYCQGTGIRGSYFTPGKRVQCDCPAGRGTHNA